MSTNSSLPFIEILRCKLKAIVKDVTLSPIDKKEVLCVVEDFEDGKWRLSHFMDYIWDNVAETALNEKEKSALGNRHRSILSRSAQNLRIIDDESTGGEIAEILLYAIMKDYYSALPAVPKIFYKQNRNDFAKGADSVHIVIDKSGEFSLWLGEAKFYNSLDASRLAKIVDSVQHTLGTQAIKKENSIILGAGNLDDLHISAEVKQKIKDFLNNDISIDKLKPRLHVPILLLHECEITQRAVCLDDEYKSEIETKFIDTVNLYFKKQIEQCATIWNYSQIHFHLIIFPVPKKSDIVTSFISEAKRYRHE